MYGITADPCLTAGVLVYARRSHSGIRWDVRSSRVRVVWVQVHVHVYIHVHVWRMRKDWWIWGGWSIEHAIQLAERNSLEQNRKRVHTVHVQLQDIHMHGCHISSPLQHVQHIR